MAEITCPSGLSGVIRKLKVKEQDLLSQPGKLRSGEAMQSVLTNIWETTTESGIYTLSKDDKPIWDKILIGDFFYIQVELSRLSFGDDYPFDVPCPYLLCDKRIAWEVKLSDLDVKKLPDASKKIFLADNRFETTLPSGPKVWFRLLTGENQRRMPKYLKEAKDKLSSASLLMQVLEIEGIRKGQLKSVIVDMDADEAGALREAMDEAGCGVETEIEVECEECGNVVDINLPFDGLFLRRRRRKLKKEPEKTEEKTEEIAKDG